MSSPMSSRLLAEALVLPAAPDDVSPPAGEDAFGVGVAPAGGAWLPVAGFDHRAIRPFDRHTLDLRAWRWPGGTQGCAGSPTATGTRMVHQ
jgi:hypothetical protein